MNIKDVAKLANVSIATVSRVINKTAKVSEKAEKRVLEVLEETGYRPNSLAKELQRNKTYTIGVLLPRIDITVFAEAVEGISTIIKKNGYNILLANSREDIEEELNYFNIFHEKRVDGIIFFSPKIIDKHKKIIKKSKIPTIIIGEDIEDIKATTMHYDIKNGTRMAIKHLIELGHKKIAFLGIKAELNEMLGKLTYDTYTEIVDEYDLRKDKNYVTRNSFEIGDGYKATKEIMENSEEKPEAIFAVTDHLAITAMNYLYENGYKVPEDISIIGIDDMAISSFTNPPLTTVSYNYELVGEKAAKLLLNMIDKKEDKVYENIIVDYELKIRKSTMAKK